MNPRRQFIQKVSIAGVGLLSGGVALSADLPMLSEKDPAAVPLGYVADASKVDKAKFPKYAAGQACNNCMLYQGKLSDASAGCVLFAGKQVAGKGWCSAYVKKA